MTPPRSPTPSPSLSAKLRGYTWYTTADFHQSRAVTDPSLSDRGAGPARPSARAAARAPAASRRRSRRACCPPRPPGAARPSALGGPQPGEDPALEGDDDLEGGLEEQRHVLDREVEDHHMDEEVD